MGRIVGGMGRVVPKETLDARTDAAALVAAARAEADAIRAQTLTAREEAIREGRAQGREEGRAEAAAELAALLADARVQAARARETSAPTAVTLALKMAAQIVGR